MRLVGSTRLKRAYDLLVADWTWLDLVREDRDTAAGLWARRHAAGRPIEDSDLLIATGALRADATLVTNNQRHYEDLGVPLDNWLAE